MRKYKRKFLSSLMCFVMGLSSGANAGAHQKKKSSSNESLTLPEWGIVIPTIILGHELIFKPLVSKLFGKSGNNNKNEINGGWNLDPNDDKYAGINNEDFKKAQLIMKENERKAYIQKVLNSVYTVVDGGLEYLYLETIPSSLVAIRKILHCLFLYNYKVGVGEIQESKLEVDKDFLWSFWDLNRVFLTPQIVRDIMKMYNHNVSIIFDDSQTNRPIERFKAVLQKWVKEMEFKSVEIVMDDVGSRYASDYWKSSIKVKIHGFKYQLSDDERMSLMDKLGLKDGDTLEVVNDNEDNEDNENIIIIKQSNGNDNDNDNDWDDN